MKGIYIDDQPTLAKAWAKKLESERLKIDVIEPEADLLALAARVIEARPSIVILDYRLDQMAVGPSAAAVGYRAAPIAQQLRDRIAEPNAIDFPIVLISSEEKIRQMFRPEKTAHDLFDWKLIKSKVGKDKTLPAVLVGLAAGYEKLRSIDGAYGDPSVFGLTEDQRFLIDHQELRVALEQAEYPHIVARYLLSFIVRRQGLLLDRNNLYARLGIAPPDAAALAGLEDWLSAEKYRGVFSKCRECWWATLVDDRFRHALGGGPNSLTAEKRAIKLSELLGVQLNPAVDTWTESSDFSPSFACACCKLPTPLNHSLSCFDSRLPSFVQRLRVCYRCILTDKLQEASNSFEEGYALQIDANEEVIAVRIRSHDLRPENS